jgi:serine/threonine-protein kinase HipA
VNICPITYEEFIGKGKFSIRGLRLLSKKLTDLSDLEYTAEEQRREAVARATKMSIGGVQPKLSAKLDSNRQSFVIVDTGGVYILKPQSHLYPELPENEDLTMRLAASVGLEIPLHGLVYSKDGSRTYFIKRFDRIGKRKKLAVEDFAQLLGKTRDTKYDSSVEQVAHAVETYCTFPLLENIKLFKVTIVNYLVGNEDMHLKKFSLIRREGKVEFSPFYDLLNTTIALQNPVEELALPLMGKKRHLTGKMMFEYFAKDRLSLSKHVLDKAITEIAEKVSTWNDLIDKSFLSAQMKQAYRDLLSSRRKHLHL